jgi:hypothetical protein
MPTPAKSKAGQKKKAAAKKTGGGGITKASTSPAQAPAKKRTAKDKLANPTPSLRNTVGRACKQVPIVIAPVLTCGVEAMIKGRVDEVRLRTHLEAIEAHRLKYKARKQKIKTEMGKGNVARKHELPSHRGKITEAKGEHAATLWCLQTLKGYELRSGFSAGVGIDQVWAKKNTAGKVTDYALVEAKGPGATLSTAANKGDQMSKQWVKSSLQDVLGSPTASDADKADARAMLRGMRAGGVGVHGYVIEALANGGARQAACPDKGIYHYVDPSAANVLKKTGK